jgi:hypothetical protein
MEDKREAGIKKRQEIMTRKLSQETGEKRKMIT